MIPPEIPDIFARVYKPREPWAHKGDFGYVLVVAGSAVHSGSPIFNTVGALRAGADLAVARGDVRAMNITASYAPDIITKPFSGVFNEEEAVSAIAELGAYQSLVIGCGLPRTKDSFSAIRAIIRATNIPIVADAEAIRAIAEDREVVRNKKMILTPNSEEFRILTGEIATENESDRMIKVRTWADKLGVTILLKGNVDVISDGTRIFVNRTGNPGMTKGGFGDTLTGIAGGMLARGEDPFEIACLAAYVNGRAGDKAVELHGEEGTLASDMLEHISKVIKEMKMSEFV